MMCEFCRREIGYVVYDKKYIVDGMTSCHLCFHNNKARNMSANFRELPVDVILQMVRE